MKPTTALVAIILCFTFAVCYTMYLTNSGYWIVLLFLFNVIIYLNDKDVTLLKNYLNGNIIVFDIFDEQRILCLGCSLEKKLDELKRFECVEKIEIINTPFKYASKQLKKENSVISVGKYKIGGDQKVVFIGGPCSIENYDSISNIAEGVKKAGANILRGGAYKPRTSPYSFQGLK